MWLLLAASPLAQRRRRDLGQLRPGVRRPALDRAAIVARFRQSAGQSPGRGALRPARAVGRLQQRRPAAGGQSQRGTGQPAVEERPVLRHPPRRRAGRLAAAGVRRFAGASPSLRCIPHERQNIQQLRDVRVEAAGKTYQLARGEFHRHTEYTAHRDGDGSLEDMWRYAQDAADMDWMGNADHDNGWGQQYAWWTIQKTMRHLPQPALVHRPLHLRAEHATGPTATAT